MEAQPRRAHEGRAGSIPDAANLGRCGGEGPADGRHGEPDRKLTFGGWTGGPGGMGPRLGVRGWVAGQRVSNGPMEVGKLGRQERPE